MKKTKIIYWVSTVIVCLAMIFSSYSDLFSDEVKTAFVHLGFPNYFRIQLGIMKIIGIILLVGPIPTRFKEMAYSGFAITFVTACIAHTMSGDPIANRAAPLVILAFLLISYFSFHKKRSVTHIQA